MNSIWFSRIYYVFGFLLMVFVILVITCSEVSLLMCYFHLCSEVRNTHEEKTYDIDKYLTLFHSQPNQDYRWAWRAFTTAGASGFYVFLYSIVYYVRKLHIGTLSSTVLYFGWSLVISTLFVTLTGSVGYLATLYFVRKIFQSIKVD